MTFEFVIPKAAASDAAETAELLMDDETFAGFYERTSRPLWAYLARVSANPAVADDLLQESYLRFLCATHPWKDGEVACRRYLFRIATNLLHDHWRRPRHAPLEDIPEAALVVREGRHSDRIDSQTLLATALARMSPRQSQLLWLAYAEGYSHAEIAEIMGLGTASVRILLFRAKHKMAGLLRRRMEAGARKSR
jgi:RNA polymerase sigma-70 factor, ECF subfamily